LRLWSICGLSNVLGKEGIKHHAWYEADIATVLAQQRIMCGSARMQERSRGNTAHGRKEAQLGMPLSPADRQGEVQQRLRILE